MYEDAKPDVYLGMDVDPANTPLLPMPTVVPPPPMGSSEQRHCRFHAAGGVHQHRLTDEGRREAALLVGALERFELQPPGRVARELALTAVSPDDGRVGCVQLGDAAVLGHRPGRFRAVEPAEGLPLFLRLSVRPLVDAAGLKGVRQDSSLYVALWSGGADAWRREFSMWPLTPQALGTHAVLVATHSGSVEVVFGEGSEHRLQLAGGGEIIVPTISRYRLANCRDHPKLLMVACTRQAEGADQRAPAPCAVPAGADDAAGTSQSLGSEPTGGDAGEPAAEEQQQQRGPDRGSCGADEDVRAHVQAALARIMAAAGPPPATEAMEEDDQRRERSKKREAVEAQEAGRGLLAAMHAAQGQQPGDVGVAEAGVDTVHGPESGTVGGTPGDDDRFEGLGVKDAQEVVHQVMEVADKAGPKTGEVETCRHWAKGWCMRAEACRFAHPQPPVPQGVPRDLLLFLRAIDRVGAIRLHRSQHHEMLLREVVEKAQAGGLPTVGYMVAHGGRTVWEVALPCGMAALLTPFPVVPWRRMVALQEMYLWWACTWHSHPAGMDPHGWQARVVVTYLSWALPTASVTWTRLWDRAVRWA